MCSKRAPQMLRAEWLADQESVQTDGHYTGVILPLFVQNVELIDNHVSEVGRRDTDAHESGEIVEFKRVGYRNEASRTCVNLNGWSSAVKSQRYSTPNSAKMCGVLSVP
ncbi:hypothetical protein CCACVL1_01416 [Corchorus capsularis]|uniref:Uncharacterized protein n=1 Tax=Corchorus capsularis TaxID=210143 RepID=A0A1R3KIQ3_COCAP|nr:hypothetical protein CCACVL1_01416 [Corchorus capsularis]